MTVAEYNAYCRQLPHTSHVVQWGGASVWKVAGKVFAIAWGSTDADLEVTFKVSPLSYDLMKDQDGLRPAPYLASRGMSWIQRTTPESLDDAGLFGYLAESHRIVASGLPKRLQKQLGFSAAAPAVSKPADLNRSSTSRNQRSSRGEQP